MYTIFYDQDVVKKDIPRLDKKIKETIKQAIEKKLMAHPEIFGTPLRSNLAGYRKLRIGDYRVVFMIKKQMVIILIICHRSEVYKIAPQRK